MKHRGVAANVKGGRGGSSSITSTAMAEYEHEERGPIKLARRVAILADPRHHRAGAANGKWGSC